MNEFLKIVTSLLYHSVIIISVYERTKRLIRSVSKYKTTGSEPSLKMEVLLFVLTVVLAIVLYRVLLYPKLIL